MTYARVAPTTHHQQESAIRRALLRTAKTHVARRLGPEWTARLIRWRRGLYEAAGSDRYSRPGLNDLDRKLAQYVDLTGGFFIEAGANDGFTQSNTYYLERFKGWRGILVEGIPELAARCRAQRPSAQLFECALVADGYPHSTVEMTFCGLMSVTEGAFASTDRTVDDHLASGSHVQGLRPYSLQVPARTLTAVLDEANPPPVIDLFSLDVEGFELEVLKGLDFDRYRPRYLLIEALKLPPVEAYLAPHYELVDALTHHDYLFRARS